MSIDALVQAVHRFFEEEILSKTSGFKQFLTGLVGSAYIEKIPQLINQNKQTLQTLDFLTPDNTINIENVYNHAKRAAQKTGSFTVSGIIFTDLDIEKLYSLIKGVR